MSIEHHPKFDDSGFYKINDNHLMVFLHSDGFTERLLGVDIFITKFYEVEIYLRSFKKGNNYGDFRYENHTVKLPNEVFNFLKKINQLEKLEFGYNKIDKSFMEDCQRQEILFNHSGKTIGFFISGGMTLKIDDFETDFGQSFYAFYKFLDNWKEKIYINFNENHT
ncbi:hypothetical protein LXD69_17755 [Flavobacterium sediminilitoris]|uniref:Immunity protein 42 of polymorphic toxin system n=1 Tax=Flavobacterium sediminilitoris TaxID=2024526 RepID=A0ABY4HLZ4_9FLAO|nr:MULTISPECIES: hypothetical protein [Flavobacterium]UOX33866.1 hypothetical protein LXD69_17755 [Flavobacterium sediminilitoris]